MKLITRVIGITALRADRIEQALARAGQSRSLPATPIMRTPATRIGIREAPPPTSGGPAPPGRFRPRPTRSRRTRT